MINSFKNIAISLLILIVSLTEISAQSNKDIFDKTVFLHKQKSNVYTLLNELSNQSGLLFIYDSNVIDNENVVKIKEGKRRLEDAIKEVVGDNIDYENIGKHILITSKHPKKDNFVTDSLNTNYLIIEGRLLDASNNTPIAFGSVGIFGSSIGTISNQEGVFRLIIPESISHSSEVCFSHLGYEQQKIAFTTLLGGFVNISLQQRIMTLPEVVIQSINPVKLIDKMRKNIVINYYTSPCYLTTFYREGIDYNNSFRTLTEAVVKLYKSSYKHPSMDQVHLLKMRKLTNYTINDTVIAKMSSGLDASLKLDVIKEIPDFILSANNSSIYNYRYVESTIIDDKQVDVISFIPKNEVVDPHYAGRLYINSDDYALVRVEMCILPKMVKNATDMFVSKQAQSLKLTLSVVNYQINYKKFGEHYFLNHVRGDIYFKAKKRKKLFGSSIIHTWFEMLPCKIDTINVVKFNKNERLSTTTVFSETAFEYDHNFWGEYNSITLEQKIEDVIKHITPKIDVMK